MTKRGKKEITKILASYIVTNIYDTVSDKTKSWLQISNTTETWLDDLYGTKDRKDVKYLNLKGDYEEKKFTLDFFNDKDVSVYTNDISFDELIYLICICIKKELPIYDLQNQGNNWNQFYN